MKEGDKVIVVSAWDGTIENSIGTLQKIRDDTYKIDGDWYYKANVFPISAEQDIHHVQMTREKLRVQLLDSMTLVYELMNKRSRGEYK